jgi:hypothetical protein
VNKLLYTLLALLVVAGIFSALLGAVALGAERAQATMLTPSPKSPTPPPSPTYIPPTPHSTPPAAVRYITFCYTAKPEIAHALGIMWAQGRKVVAVPGIELGAPTVTLYIQEEGPSYPSPSCSP